MAYIGDWNAILDRTSADGVKTKESGRVAWILWRSAYFTMTLSMRNKWVGSVKGDFSTNALLFLNAGFWFRRTGSSIVRRFASSV